MHWRYKRGLEIIARLVKDNNRNVFKANEIKAVLNEEMGNASENNIMLRDFVSLGRLIAIKSNPESKRITSYKVQIPNFPLEINIEKPEEGVKE